MFKDDVDDAKLDDHGQHLLLQLSGPAPLPGEVDQLGRQQVKLSNPLPVVSNVVQYMSRSNNIDLFVPFSDFNYQWQ